MHHWLMKSEPDVYGLDRLKAEGTTGWDGIRNYQARNFMRDTMQVGDKVLFYHSNSKPPGIAGTAVVSKLHLVDPTQFDPASPYYDPKSSPDNPRWEMVELRYESHFKHYLPLGDLRAEAPLKDMLLLKKGMRLSIQPVTAAEFKHILKLGQKGIH